VEGSGEQEAQTRAIQIYSVLSKNYYKTCEFKALIIKFVYINNSSFQFKSKTQDNRELLPQ